MHTHTPNAIVRAALAPTMSQFNGWRSDLARFAVRAERRAGERDRIDMLARCTAIEDELRAARTDILIELADAPRAIAGHSRVADVEKALDNIEATLRDIRRRLNH